MTDDTPGSGDDATPSSGERFVRKSTILAELPIHPSTLDDWIKTKRFPAPVVLNPGAGREIIAWRERDYQKWKDDRPQRQAAPITEAAYEKKRKPKPEPEPKIIIKRPE